MVFSPAKPHTGKNNNRNTACDPIAINRNIKAAKAIPLPLLNYNSLFNEKGIAVGATSCSPQRDFRRDGK
jgi:hypothetical protein